MEPKYMTGTISKWFQGPDDHSLKLAGKALIFMAKSLFRGQKSVIAYYLTGKSVSVDLLTKVIEDIIIELESNTSIRIRCVIGDFAPCDVGSRTLLGAFCQRNNVVFYNNNLMNGLYPNRKLFCIGDPGHLIENLRYSLMKQDIIYEFNQEVTWDIIKTLALYVVKKYLL